MAATVTLTGTAGPANAVTAVPFTGVISFLIEPDKNMITLYRNGDYISVSIAAATTVTATKSGSNWTLTIS